MRGGMRRKHRRASQPAHTPPLAAVSALSLVLLGMFAVGTASAPSAAASSRLSYGEALAQGVGAMENGRHTQALAPLRLALLQDRNDPLSTLTLGILYLHTGSPVRAQKEFARARALAPGDALAVVGSALAALAQGRVEDADALLKSLPAETAPEFGTLRDYVRVLTGQSAAVRAETAGVTAEEGDALAVPGGRVRGVVGGRRVQPVVDAVGDVPDARRRHVSRRGQRDAPRGGDAGGGRRRLGKLDRRREAGRAALRGDLRLERQHERPLLHQRPERRAAEKCLEKRFPARRVTPAQRGERGHLQAQRVPLLRRDARRLRATTCAC